MATLCKASRMSDPQQRARPSGLALAFAVALAGCDNGVVHEEPAKTTASQTSNVDAECAALLSRVTLISDAEKDGSMGPTALEEAKREVESHPRARACALQWKAERGH